MALLPLGPPVSIPIAGGFDYVTVDAAHRRVYAAHSGAKALLIVNADTGKVIRQITVGPMHGVAYNAAGTKVYTGDGDDNAISEVDPVTFSVLRTIRVSGPVDAIAYDESNEHIYADEDDGTRMFVIDASSMKQIATIPLPGHKPEYLAVDPRTHVVYQNIADKSEVAIIDPKKLIVSRVFRTPGLVNNHPLQYDAASETVLSGGADGVLSGYAPSGARRFTIAFPRHVDQCDLDQTKQLLACAGGTGITVAALHAGAPPTIIGTYHGKYHVHTLAFDAKTHHVFAAMVDLSAGNAGYVQRFSVRGT